MRKLLLLTTMLFLLIGCASDQDQANSQAVSQPTTIFGRLSELVQFGSSEETIAHKLQADSLFVTMNGQVLMKYPAYINFEITDIETGAVRSDLNVALTVCQAVDEDFWQAGSCTDFDGDLYQYELTAVPFEDGYRVDGFEWDRSGGWNGFVTVTSADGTIAETIDFGTEVYPVRPPSTNTFELVSISLPFLVIAIFFLLMKLFKVQVIPQYELS